MEEKKKENTCLNCKTTSEQAVLLQCENKGKLEWVCVRCLPILIHGAH